MLKLGQLLGRNFRSPFGTVIRSAPPNTGNDGESAVQISSRHFCANAQHPGQKHRKKNQHEEPDREWFNKFIRKRQATLEAFGWSTALVLGIQLSQLWHIYNRTSESRRLDPETRHRLCRLYQLAVSMPLGANQVIGTYKSILPATGSTCTSPLTNSDTSVSSSSQPKHGITEKQKTLKRQGGVFANKEGYRSLIDDVIQPIGDLKFPKESESSSICDSEWSKESYLHVSEYTSLRQDEPEKNSEHAKECGDMPFPEFAEEWQKLVNDLCGTEGNERGLQYFREANFTAAFESWKTAGDETKYPAANFNTALCYELGRGVQKDLVMACEYYHRAAEAGHIQAAYNLAILALHRPSPSPLHHKTPEDLLALAAEGGLAQAMVELGVLKLEMGNNEEGFNWLQKATAERLSDADYYMGICYEHGLGVAQDMCKAVEHYAVASEAGHTRAVHSMGQAYEFGRGGLAIDLNLALECYERAKQAGDEEAEQDFNRLDEQLQKERIDSVVQNLLKIPARHDNLRTQSSPTLSDYFQHHLCHSWDSGFSSPEDSVSFLNLMTKDVSRSNSREEKNKNMNQSHGCKEEAQIQTSISKLQMQLLLGKNIFVPELGKGCQKPVCEDGEDNVIFSIGSESEKDDAESRNDTANLHGNFGVDFGQRKIDQMSSFSFEPLLNGGSFGKVSLQKK